ncbi:hypothetical protein [Parasphingorhabdus sp.]|uniref:hypothetical protein n=1 Tax=Parasphingorhabdus sp. TaxID=2709688 RepID=UPI0009EE8012
MKMTPKRTILVQAAVVATLLFPAIGAAGAAPAAAQTRPGADPRENVKIESTIKVERVEQNDSGAAMTKLVNPNDVKVVPGDRLVFINAYRNTGRLPVTGFVVNNPIPEAVMVSDVADSWALVSVDGGKNFGQLVTLQVAEPVSVPETADEADALAVPAETMRPAQASDITHIRWVFKQAIAPGASGELKFRGIVR